MRQPTEGAASEPLADNRLPPQQASMLQRVMVDYYERLENPVALHGWKTKRIRGELRQDLVARSIAALLDRHLVLRTRFVRDGANPTAVEIAHDVSVQVAYHDLGGVNDLEREAEVERVIEHTIVQWFDLDRGPLMRACLIRLAASDHLLTVVLHHAVSDAWSFAILFRDFVSLYTALATNTAPALPPQGCQFMDHVQRQLGWFGSETGEADREFWTRRLQNCSDPFWLPDSAPPPTDESPDSAASYINRFTVSGSTLERLRKSMQGQGYTIAMALNAATAAALANWSGRSDVLIKILHSGRYDEDLHETVGCLIAAWILRVNLDAAADLGEVLRRVRLAHFESLPHIRYPFALLHRHLAQQCSHPPLLDITVNYIAPAVATARETRESEVPAALVLEDFEGVVHLRDFSLDELTGMKLVVQFEETLNALTCVAWCAWTRFSKMAIDRFCRNIRSSLESLAAATDEPATGAKSAR